MSIQIIKENGEKEIFDRNKLKNSLLKAHATVIVANDIVDKISENLKNGASTTEIYKKAFELLKNKEEKTAIKYSIRRSLLELGPSGFPFEDFVAEIFEAKGYKTKNGIMLKGKCIEHEIDVVAYNDNDLYITEVKFHNQHGIKSDTRTALYIKARFDDLMNVDFEIDGKIRKMTRGILVTNTKFTDNSKKYVNCVGTFDLIGWEYPQKGNLYQMIEETGLHPLTCIPQLSRKNKEDLLSRGIVNCKDLKNQSTVMREIGINDVKIKEIIDNIEEICTH